MITAFGKRVRQYRIEIDAVLGQMAEALNCSPAYLSAVELGKKPLHDDFVKKIVTYLKSRGCDASDLWKLADEEKKEVTVNVENFDLESKRIVAGFARSAPSWPPQKMWALRKLLEDD